LVRLGYFGSCARGDWGVGSDLDLVAVLEDSALPFDRRSFDWDLTTLPVPADLVVYTRAEWERLQSEAGRFARTLARETVWLIG
jgi:predicted nucleotidyltransferase